jgi:hypothetical protein
LTIINFSLKFVFLSAVDKTIVMLQNIRLRKLLLHQHNISTPFSFLKVFLLSTAFIVFFSCNSKKYQDQANSNRGKSYYVSVSGNDTNPGTEEMPFKSLQKINTLVLQPGDALYLKGGETFNGKLSLTLNGTKDDTVLLTSYGEGRAVINGGNDQAISLGGKYFKLTNINAKGSGRKSGNTTAGIQLIETSNAVIENVHVEGFQKSGLGLWNCKNMLISKVVAENNGFCGIYTEGTGKKDSRDIVIKDCAANNNPGDPTNSTNHSGNGILVGLSTKVLIDHCSATENGWDMPRIGNGPVGIWAYEADSVTIQYCISYRNKTHKGAKDGGGFDFDGGVTNSVLQYCLSYENEGAGYGLFQYYGASPWYNNTMRYCLSINDAQQTEGSGGIFIWSSDPDSTHLSKCYVYNNVVYSMHSPAVEFEQASLNTQFFFTNNIFIGKGNIINGPASGEKFIGNVWWSPESRITFRNYASLQDWANASGQEKLNGKLIGRQTDPLLKSPFTTGITDPYQLDKLTGYMLQPVSPLKNTGMDVTGLFKVTDVSMDMFGNKVPMGSRPEPGLNEIKE